MTAATDNRASGIHPSKSDLQERLVIDMRRMLMQCREPQLHINTIEEGERSGS